MCSHHVWSLYISSDFSDQPVEKRLKIKIEALGCKKKSNSPLLSIFPNLFSGFIFIFIFRFEA